MIQHINILTMDGKSLLFREYGAIKVDQDLLAGFISAFSGFMQEISQSQIKSTVTGNTRYYYRIDQPHNLIFLAAAEIKDKEEEIAPKIESISKKFIDKYGSMFKDKSWSGDRAVFKPFLEEIDRIILGPIKVSIVGYGGVGKSTLLRLLVGKEINLEYVPTITADIANLDGLGSRQIVLWDFAGQIQFSNLWQSLLNGTRIVFLVTDSTYQNITESKKIITNLIRKYYQDTIIIGIANKQDLPNRLTPEFVQKILEVPTYGMIGINEDYRAKIIEILSQAIDQVNAQDHISAK
jgi:small GTP-binding protein